MSTNLAQKRAEFCLKELEALQCDREDFRSFSAGLPAMILQNGFGQTLAFLVAKASKKEKGKKKTSFNKRDKHYAAFEIIKKWLQSQEILAKEEEKKDKKSEKEILDEISKMNQKKYLHAQRETLAMLEWLKRYANAALFEETEND